MLAEAWTFGADLLFPTMSVHSKAGVLIAGAFAAPLIVSRWRRRK